MPAKKLTDGKANNVSKVLYVAKRNNSGNDGEIVWRNPSSSVLEVIEANVPLKILLVMNSLEKYVSNSLEFGLYLKGTYDKGVLAISEEFYVPKQQVSGASIDFDPEDDGNGEWNGVIHRHPNGCTGFSGTDNKSINENHMFSLLYESSKIVKGIINLKPSDNFGLIQLPLDIEVEYPHYDEMSEMSSRITQKAVSVRRVTSSPTKSVDGVKSTHDGARRIGQPGAIPSMEEYCQYYGMGASERLVLDNDDEMFDAFSRDGTGGADPQVEGWENW